MTQAEYEAEMIRITQTHTAEVVYLVNLNVLGAQVCVTMGHSMHLIIAEAVRCYCNAHNITLDQLRACAIDMDRLSGSIAELADMPDEITYPSSECNDLLNRFR